jgi:hypothetical protein
MLISQQMLRSTYMSVQTEDLEPFVNRVGPVFVIRASGVSVSYGTSGRLGLIDPNRKDAWNVEQLQLTLFDEQTRIIRVILASQIIQVRQEQPGYTVVVDDAVKADEGPSIVTRGA